MRALPRLILAGSLLCLALSGCSEQTGEVPASGRGADPSQDPLYASYRFGQRGVIDLGVQPLTLPEGGVAELISRDRVLAERLKRGGATLQSFPFYKGKDVYHFMSRGKLEAGIFADMPSLVAAATGDIVIVAMLKQGFASIVSEKPMLVKDLKGMRVATGLGSAAHFTLLSALENEGLTERDVRLIGMEVNDMPQALAEDRIDAFSAWEPTPVLAFAAHPEFRLVHKSLSYGFLCFRRDFVAAHPAEAREIAAAVLRSCLWMRIPENIDRAAGWTQLAASRFQGREYPLTADQMAALTRRDLLNIPGSPQIPEVLLGEHGLLWKKFNFLKETGKIPQTTPWEKVRNSFDTEMLRAILSEPKRNDLEKFDYRGEKQQGATP